MGAFDHRKALAVLIGALLVAPAAHAWILTPRPPPIAAENTPGIIPIGFAVLDSPTEDVTWECSTPAVKVLVGQAYLHAATGVWRRNLGVDVNPPSGESTATCDLHGQMGELKRIAIEFTILGIEIEFTSAG